MTNYDIIIIGGGMVGASLACALQTTSLRVALIDATPLTPSEDPRLIALNDSSCCLLKNLNVWPRLIPHAEAIKEVHVSYKGKFGTTRITSDEIGITTLGHVIPAKYINSALYESLNDISNVEIIRPATLKNFSQTESSITIEIEKNSVRQNLAASIMIGADGTHSTVRKLLGIPTKIIDYNQSAIVTETELQRSHRNIAYERFHSSGAIAMLPLTENHSATIWSDSNDNIQHLQTLTDSEFLEHLQKEFGYRLGRLKKIKKRHVFPLQMICAERYIESRTILIGNAAHTLHPVAAQGLNLALREVATLAENFAKQSADNISLQHVFNETTQQKSSISLSHYLPQLFTNDFFGVRIARQLGMLGLDICSIAKRRFAQHALGRAGRVPQLILED